MRYVIERQSNDCSYDSGPIRDSELAIWEIVDTESRHRRAVATRLLRQDANLITDALNTKAAIQTKVAA